ncbi:ATP-dependent DNA helicase UvsW [Gammaproteobacteria bacterium]
MNAPEIRLDGNITISGTEPESTRRVMEANTYANPKYSEAIRQGRSVRWIDHEIRTYQETDCGLVLPRGYLSELRTFEPNCRIEDHRTDAVASFPAPQGVTLRPYQLTAVEEALKAEQGIIQAPTGSGKTVMGMSLLARLNRRALVLTHSTELAKQWQEVIRQRLGIEAGIIGGGKWTEGEIITVAMLQTLHRNPERTRQIAKSYGVTLNDEVHHVCATTFAEVLSWLPARYRYGLSATPHRRDGLDVLIHRVVGPTLARVEKADVEQAGGTVPAVVKVIESGFVPGYVESWGEFVDSLIGDDGRNRLIIAMAEKAATAMPTLVLVERIEHAETLAALASVPCVMVHGGLPAKERTTAMAAISGARLTIGTVGMLGEGLDVSGWGALVLASPISSKVRLNQAIGRILRPHMGKTRGYVADILDKHPLALASFKKRHAIYRDQRIQVT